jgi:hypothetical protein
MRALLNFFTIDLYELLIPARWRFKCPECKDTGWASYSDRIGPRTYHNHDHCRKCRPRQRPFR